MLQEHLTCPKCDYDLHGIPAVRCPECGFRYDADALRDIASSSWWTRLASADALILRAAFTAGLSIPAICDALGIAGWTLFGVLAVVYVAVCATWIRFGNIYGGISTIPTVLTLFVAIAIGFRYTLPILHLVATVPLTLGWMVRLREWPALSEELESQTVEFRHQVEHHSRAGTTLLIVATLLFVTALAF